MIDQNFMKELIIAGVVFSIIVILFQLWALIDILKSDFREKINKIIWILLVCFFPVIGTILYFAIGKNQKVSE
jgi:hypothetical protein